MTPETKRSIADWMGWEHYKGNLYWLAYPGGRSLQEACPHIDPDQFLKVLKNLSREQTKKLSAKLGNASIYNHIHDFIWLSDNKPEVIDAILEVIP